MAIPRAAGGGMFGGGVQPAPSPVVDYGSLISGAVSGASSLIHNAALRKMAERKMALEEQRLQLEHEQHMATLDATKAYREAILGLRAQQIQAPDERKLKAQKDARAALTTEYPGHPALQPDENGNLPDENTYDFAGALKTARWISAKDEVTRVAGEIRQNMQDLRLRANANKPMTPNQSLQRKNRVLAAIATASNGDPEAARKAIASDPALARDISQFGVQDYEIAAAVGSAAEKKAARQTQQNMGAAASGQVPSSVPGKTPTPGDVNAYREGLSVKPPTAFPGGTVPRIRPVPSQGAGTNPGGLDGITGTTPSPASMQAPAAQPPAGATVTPLRVPRPRAAVTAQPGQAAAPAGLNMQGIPKATQEQEAAMSHADLWEHKRQQGLTPEAATAYVTKIKGAPQAPKAPDQQDPMPPQEFPEQEY